MASWKLQDLHAEDSTAHNYDYLYDRTRFAKMMYSDFAMQVEKLARGSQKILEIGCGTGTVSSLIRSEVQAHGMDFSRNMLTVAKKKRDWATLVEADMEHMPYADHSFNLVMAHSTIHHFPSLEKLLCEVARVLKPGGYLVVQEPNSFDFQRPFLIRAVSYASRKAGLKVYPNVAHMEIKPSEHHAPLPMSKLVDAMESCNLRIERKDLRYFSSNMLAGFDSPLTHAIGKMLDSYYVRKYQGGYMYLVVARVK